MLVWYRRALLFYSPHTNEQAGSVGAYTESKHEIPALVRVPHGKQWWLFPPKSLCGSKRHVRRVLSSGRNRVGALPRSCYRSIPATHTREQTAHGATDCR